jgi:beta-mannosidase
LHFHLSPDSIDPLQWAGGLLRIDLTKQKWTLSGWRPNYFHQRKANQPPGHWQPDIPPIPAIVPGSAQTALRRAGWLEDWLIGLNSLDCEWVEHRQWEFSTGLKPIKIAPGDSITLHCDGLDYSGWIAIDGQIIADFRGALRRHQFDLTPHLLDGKPHTLSILFDEPPPEQGQVGATSQSEYFKPRYNDSWDWCPRFVPVGIWDRIWIKAGPPCPRVTKVLTSLAEDLKTGRVNIFIENPPEGKARQIRQLRAVLRQGRKEIASATQPISARHQVLRIDNIPVEPWFPNGAGKQPLYELKVTLSAHAGRDEVSSVSSVSSPPSDEVLLDSRTVGFKRVRWLDNPGAPKGARPMLCEINGQALFLQGVNWTPIHLDYHATTRADYQRPIDLYREMGCNILRVWGGGFLEREDFYDLCDRAGLLVWQEFPLSSSGPENYPPESPEAIKELERIATDYIHRRAHHACKLLWCGGNELQSLPNEKGEQFPLTESHPALAAMKHVVEHEDPDTRYLPTSPTGPVFFAERQHMGKGIHHHVHGPWNHLSLESAQDYFAHDDATFRSECGMPGAQSLAMMKKYAGDEDLWPAVSDNPLWTHSSLWWLPKQAMLEQIKGISGAAALKKYVLLSQQLQGDVLSLAARTCKDRFPTCGGFLIWMGHDCFPCQANTSIIDVEQNPKPAYDRVKEVFQSSKNESALNTPPPKSVQSRRRRRKPSPPSANTDSDAGSGTE